MAEEITLPVPPVTSQKGALVGDEAVQAAGYDVEPEVKDEQVAAQVAPKRDADPKKVAEHEVVVHTDKVITDPSSPEAVQVPDAGRGSLDLPIHDLAKGSVEDRFAEADSDSSSDSAPADNA